MEKIAGLTISEHNNSKRIINIDIENEIIEKTSESLKNGDAVGWFQGRMEFGPRALGGRSILGDPRSSIMQKNLNLKVKYRESFRPFAPSILRDNVNDWFELNEESPYMLLDANIKKEKQKHMTEDEKKLFGIEKLNIKRSEIPAVTHVDYSARIQTVSSDTNKKYYDLILDILKNKDSIISKKKLPKFTLRENIIIFLRKFKIK